jgi:leucyl-tRNA---protein transferase
LKYYEFLSEHECGYFEDKEAVSVNNIFVEDCPAFFADMLMMRGWRRFGKGYFRPMCPECGKCESIRVSVDEFALSKSFRNVKNRNKETLHSLHRPSYSDEKLELYRKYHIERSQKRGWKLNEMDEEKYNKMFVEGAGDFGYEIRYFRDAKLIGIDYVDILPDGISSIYFFCDPDYAHLSLGTYSLLIQLDIAKQLGLKQIYLGYIVRENQSLMYKLKYKPHQILEGRPKNEEETVWS